MNSEELEIPGVDSSPSGPSVGNFFGASNWCGVSEKHPRVT